MHKRMRVLLLVIGATPLVGLLILWFLYLCPLGSQKPFDRERFEQVVAAIRHGSLPDHPERRLVFCRHLFVKAVFLSDTG